MKQKLKSFETFSFGTQFHVNVAIFLLIINVQTPLCDSIVSLKSMPPHTTPDRQKYPIQVTFLFLQSWEPHRVQMGRMGRFMSWDFEAKWDDLRLGMVVRKQMIAMGYHYGQSGCLNHACFREMFFCCFLFTSAWIFFSQTIFPLPG